VSIDTSYRDDVRGWNRRYWLQCGYTREQIRTMDPAQAHYEIAFSMRDWDEVTRLQDAGQHGFTFDPGDAAILQRLDQIGRDEIRARRRADFDALYQAIEDRYK
jgi:hypothetical protein